MAITTTATKINSCEDIYTAYRVTPEQVAACTMIEQTSPTHQIFYLVQSASDPTTEYKVQYTRERGLQCLPWDGGRTCPASAEGIPCWHERAALCAYAIYRLEQRNLSRAEAATVEADPSVQEEQAEVSAAQEAERTSRYHDSIFCGDSNCPCHDDNEKYHEYIIHPLYEGLLTVEEANRIYYGLQ